jgi:hypothetical protein
MAVWAVMVILWALMKSMKKIGFMEWAMALGSVVPVGLIFHIFCSSSMGHVGLV